MDCLDEYDYCEMMNTAVQKAVSKTERSHSLCHLPIDKERAVNDIAYLAQVTLDIFNDPARPMDEESARRRVLLIQSWENKLHTQFDSTASFLSAIDTLSRNSTHSKDIGAKLRRIRRRRHWTQAEMADVIGVDRSLFSRIERGERNIPESVVDWLKNRSKNK